MAIDTLQEKIYPLKEAAKFVPRRRGNRSCHSSTLERWIRKGVRGIHLEHVRVGSSMCTSREALQRFFEALTATDHSTEPSSIRTPTQRRRSQAQADKELDAAGIK